MCTSLTAARASSGGRRGATIATSRRGQKRGVCGRRKIARAVRAGREKARGRGTAYRIFRHHDGALARIVVA